MKLPTNLRQSLLARADVCRHSALLSLQHPDQNAIELSFGAASHAFAERLMTDLIEQGEKSLYAPAEGEDPVAAAKQVASMSAAMVDEILRDHPEFVVPIVHPSHSVDHLRQCCYHIAVGLDVDPDTVLGIEQSYELELECGRKLTGRLDLLSLPRPDVIDVADYKNSFNVPSQSDYEGLFQMLAYALLVMFGKPVDGPPMGDGIAYIRTRQLFPRYLDDDNVLRSREVLLSRQEIQDWRHDLERLASDFMGRLATLDTDEPAPFPATPGSHCAQCAAPALCPLPAELRRHAGTVNSVEDASEALASVLRSRAGADAMMKEVRAWAKNGGAVRVGDFEFDWRETEKWETDWDGLEPAIFEAAMFGKPFELGQYRKRKTVQSFAKRKLAPEEIAAQIEEEAADAGDRFGDDAPF